MKQIEISAYISLAIQIIIGTISLYGIKISNKLPTKYKLLKDILILETIVQFIELIFYSWLTFNIIQKSLPNNITAYRYFDWALSTPTMLVSTILYFKFLDGDSRSATQIILDNKNDILQIIISNWIMLLIGFLVEIGYIPKIQGIIIGFIPFYYMFYKLHKFVTKDKSKLIFKIMCFLWSLYGFAAFFNYDNKNTFYNLIDIVSKNFYSLFIFNEIYKLNKLNNSSKSI
jgi:bacteriorhodopsin